MFKDIFILITTLLIARIIQIKVPKVFNLVPFSTVAGPILFLITKLIYAFSNNVFIYNDIILSVIFGSFPLGLRKNSLKKLSLSFGLWRYGLLQYLAQWGGGLILGSCVLKFLFDLGDEFGAYLPAGFAGGHGSAAVVGDLFERNGILNALEFAMFSATVGIFLSVLGGVLLAKLYKRPFNSENIHRSKNKKLFSLPKLRLKSFLIISLIVILAMLSKNLVRDILNLNVPGFVISVFYGLFFRILLPITDKKSSGNDDLSLLSHYATNVLVIIGIGTIKPELISQAIIPFILLFLFGLIQGVMMFKYLAFKVFKEHPFEKALFTWGWTIGGLVIGLNLAFSLESSEKSKKALFEEFSMAYLLVSPFEMVLLLGAPIIIMKGLALHLGLILSLLAILLFLYMIKKANNLSS